MIGKFIARRHFHHYKNDFTSIRLTIIININMDITELSLEYREELTVRCFRFWRCVLNYGPSKEMHERNYSIYVICYD